MREGRKALVAERREEEIMGRMRKWSRVLLLALSFVLWASLSMGQEPTYVGTKKCKVCHGKQFKSWEQTKMAKAFDLLKPEEQKKPDCQSCHTTGLGKEGGFKNLEETPAMVGVQCEACHGPGSIYFRVMKDKEKRTAGGLLEQTAAVCEVCHNKKSPTYKEPFKFDKNAGIHEHFK
jgi:hypothetical protein